MPTIEQLSTVEESIDKKTDYPTQLSCHYFFTQARIQIVNDRTGSLSPKLILRVMKEDRVMLSTTHSPDLAHGVDVLDMHCDRKRSVFLIIPIDY